MDAQKKKVTVYDIARALAISPATVSRVLNNSILVREELRNRIVATAAEMGYRKRRIRRPGARSILNIALVLPHLADAHLHLFYDAAELIAGIEAGFDEVRVNIITVLSERAAALYDHKKLGDIDGCIFAFSSPDERTRGLLAELDTPWVMLNRVEERANYVSADNAGGVGLLVRRMLDTRPGSRLCYLGFTPIPAVNELRERGFICAAAGAGLSDERTVIRRAHRLEDIDREMIEDLRRSGVDGLLCFNDVVAVYVYQAATALGVRFPEEMMLSGFDDSPVRRLVTREIDTVSLSPHELGARAGRWLRKYVVDRCDEPVRLLVPGRYVPGDTIGR